MQKIKLSQIRQLTLSCLFVALGIIIPFFIHIPGVNFGQMFLPMHIPVILCSFICGYKFGGLCGLLTPLLSSIFTGMPPMPTFAVPMMFELLTYGLIAALLYKKFNVYISLIGAMVGGRIVAAIATLIVYGLNGKPFLFPVFLTTTFVTAIPGIIIQIILIPIIIIIFQKMIKSRN